MQAIIAYKIGSGKCKKKGLDCKAHCSKVMKTNHHRKLNRYLFQTNLN